MPTFTPIDATIEQPQDDHRHPASPEEPRQRPSPPGLAAAGGGLLFLAGVLTLLGEVDEDARRAAVFAAGALLVAGGLAVAGAFEGRRASAAGVAMAAAGPALCVSSLLLGTDTFSAREQVSLVAGLVALAELALFAVGPVRRHLLPLGLGLVGVWLAVLGPVLPVPAFPFAALPGTVSVVEPEIFPPPSVELERPDFELEVSAPPEAPTFPEPSGPDRPTGPEGFEPFEPPTFDFEPPTFEPPELEMEPFEPPELEIEPPQLPDGVFDAPGLAVGGGGDAGSAGILSLLIAAGYAAASAALDRRRQHATATPFAAAAAVAVIVGLALLSGELSAAATGFVALVAGAGLVAAATAGGADRRFSSWLGVLVAVFGVAAVVGDLVDDPVPVGILLLVLGAGVVAGVAAAEQSRRTAVPAEDG